MTSPTPAERAWRSLADAEVEHDLEHARRAWVEVQEAERRLQLPRPRPAPES